MVLKFRVCHHCGFYDRPQGVDIGYFIYSRGLVVSLEFLVRTVTRVYNAGAAVSSVQKELKKDWEVFGERAITRATLMQVLMRFEECVDYHDQKGGDCLLKCNCMLKGLPLHALVGDGLQSGCLKPSEHDRVHPRHVTGFLPPDGVEIHAKGVRASHFYVLAAMLEKDRKVTRKAINALRSLARLRTVGGKKPRHCLKTVREHDWGELDSCVETLVELLTVESGDDNCELKRGCVCFILLCGSSHDLSCLQCCTPHCVVFHSYYWVATSVSRFAS